MFYQPPAHEALQKRSDSRTSTRNLKWPGRAASFTATAHRSLRSIWSPDKARSITGACLGCFRQAPSKTCTHSVLPLSRAKRPSCRTSTRHFTTSSQCQPRSNWRLARKVSNCLRHASTGPDGHGAKAQSPESRSRGGAPKAHG